jgi:hypothetical protein
MLLLYHDELLGSLPLFVPLLGIIVDYEIYWIRIDHIALQMKVDTTPKQSVLLSTAQRHFGIRRSQYARLRAHRSRYI